VGGNALAVTDHHEDHMSTSPDATTRSRFHRLADLSVRTKILAAVLTVAVAALVIGVTAISQLSSVNAGAKEMYSNNLQSVDILGQIDGFARQTRIDALSHAVAADDANKTRLEGVLREDDASLDARVEVYRTLSPRKLAKIEQFTAHWADYRKGRDTILIPASRADNMPAIQRAQRDVLGPAFTASMATLDELTALESSEAKQASEAITSAYQSGRTLVIALLVGGLAVGLGLGIVVARAILRSLTSVSRVAAALAAGDLTQRAEVTSRDELGRMAGELDRASGVLRETVQALGANAQALAGSSEELSATSNEIAAAAEETGTQASVVSAAAEQVSANVQTVAASSEEMGASIREIAASSSEASSVASTAARLATDTTTTMTRLGQSSMEIGDVIKVITSIAEQTNLLALNATIEAARAGEAGKGFAVVATEVKELAQETARATEDIARRVEAIQADTQGAITAMAEITEVIGQIHDRQTTIATAVEEQSATTNEMSRNVSEASVGASEIAQNISGVASAAQTTSTGVAQANTAAADLSRMSSSLQEIVDRFRY
jgi:methyl-accepting chemotaxis protein